LRRLRHRLDVFPTRHVEEDFFERRAAVLLDELFGGARSTILPSFIMITSSQSRSTSGMLCEARRMVAPRLRR